MVAIINGWTKADNLINDLNCNFLILIKVNFNIFTIVEVDIQKVS